MANSPPSSPSAPSPLDIVTTPSPLDIVTTPSPLDIVTTMDEDEDFSDANISNMLKESDKVIQGLNESRSALLNRVEGLKQDLHFWRGKLETEVGSYNEEIVDMNNSLTSDVDQLKNEFQELRNSLKEQLAATTTKLAELDTSVADCAQFLEGMNANCEHEKSLFDDLIADLGAEGKKVSKDFKYSDTKGPSMTIVSSVTIEEVLE